MHASKRRAKNTRAFSTNIIMITETNKINWHKIIAYNYTPVV